MKKIILMQWKKLLYNREYFGFCLVGSVLVVLFGVVVVGGGLEGGLENLIDRSISRSFPAVVFLCICLYNYTIANEYRNKSIFYEKMYDIGNAAMIIGRIVVPIINSFVFIFVLFLIKVAVNIVTRNWCSFCWDNLVCDLLLTLICIMHLNFVTGLYYIGSGKLWGGILLTLVFQWVIPTGLNQIGLVDEGRLFCANQFSLIWNGVRGKDLLVILLTGFVIEVLVVYFLVYFWNYRKEWK